MKDIKAILNDSGATLTEDQVKAIVDGVGENYRTINELSKKTERIAELEKANADLAKQVSNLKGDSEELESLRNTVAEYEKAEEDRKAQQKEQEERDQFMAVFNEAVGNQEFANDLIKDSVFNQVYEKCSNSTGANAKDVLADVTKDLDGVFKNPQRDIHKMPTPEQIKAKNAEDSAAKDKSWLADQLFGGNR